MNLGRFLGITAGLAAVTGAMAFSPIAATAVAGLALTGVLGSRTVQDAKLELPCGVTEYRGCKETATFAISEPLYTPYQGGPFWIFAGGQRDPDDYDHAGFTRFSFQPDEAGFVIQTEYLQQNADDDSQLSVSNYLHAWSAKVRDLWDYCGGQMVTSKQKCPRVLSEPSESGNDTTTTSDDDGKYQGFTTADAVLGITGSVALGGALAGTVLGAKHCRKMRDEARYQRVPPVQMSQLENV